MITLTVESVSDMLRQFGASGSAAVDSEAAVGLPAESRHIGDLVRGMSDDAVTEAAKRLLRVASARVYAYRPAEAADDETVDSCHDLATTRMIGWLMNRDQSLIKIDAKAGDLDIGRQYRAGSGLRLSGALEVLEAIRTKASLRV
ncbi:MAG: hypothetical protein OXM01_14855 [Gemmatimonadota bacterium]|nr:hypothetical protein [Gemmatimonadota bacterium]